jgi:YidC/Oxa1 family membrane protein insertase
LGAETKRLITAMALMAILLGVYSFLQPKQPKQGPQAGHQQTTSAPAPAQAPSGPESAAPAVAPVPEAPEELVMLQGDGFHAELTSHGGAVRHYVLESQKFVREANGERTQIDLVRTAPAQPYPLALVASPELGGSQDLAADKSASASMRVVSHDAKSAVFEGTVGSLQVRKTYRVTGKPFELALDVEVLQAPAKGTISLIVPSFMPPDTKSGGLLSGGPPLEFERPVCRAGTKTQRFDVGGDDAAKTVEGAVQWAGVDQHYFVSAVLPPENAGATCVLARGPVKGAGVTAITVPVEGARTYEFSVYAGPKDLDSLRAYGARNLESAIDYGAVAQFFGFFARGLLYVLRWLHAVVTNWGVAIILLTLLVRSVLFPLTYKSMQSMNEMRKLQPEIEKLKAKFGADREKMNVAVMQLYQQHKVNPLGGCLPMLLQMPIWFALYAALQTSVELYREPFLWIHDLTMKDPVYALPLLMGASSFIQQKISPQPADNAQAKMMLYFFPGFFTVLMLNVPAGLTLYIFVNNLLSIIQQQVMMKRMAPPVVAPGK